GRDLPARAGPEEGAETGVRDDAHLVEGVVRGEAADAGLEAVLGRLARRVEEAQSSAEHAALAELPRHAAPHVEALPVVAVLERRGAVGVVALERPREERGRHAPRDLPRLATDHRALDRVRVVVHVRGAVVADEGVDVAGVAALLPGPRRQVGLTAY